jgi:hypothetical protein
MKESGVAAMSCSSVCAVSAMSCSIYCENKNPTCAYEKYIHTHTHIYIHIHSYSYSYALAGFILIVNITHIFIVIVKHQCMVMKYLKKSWSMLPAIVAEVCCGDTPSPPPVSLNMQVLYLGSSAIIEPGVCIDKLHVHIFSKSWRWHWWVFLQA